MTTKLHKITELNSRCFADGRIRCVSKYATSSTKTIIGKIIETINFRVSSDILNRGMF